MRKPHIIPGFEAKPYKCPGYCCKDCTHRKVNTTEDENKILCWIDNRMFKNRMFKKKLNVFQSIAIIIILEIYFLLY